MHDMQRTEGGSGVRARLGLPRVVCRWTYEVAGGEVACSVIRPDGVCRTKLERGVGTVGSANDRRPASVG